jgi:hypothetical protein
MEGEIALLFILGLVSGSCLGIFLIALVAKSKEADETVSRLLVEQEKVATNNYLSSGHHFVSFK